jgi:hypothetical protein
MFLNPMQITKYVGGKIMVMKGVPCVLMRGGTSKGYFSREETFLKTDPRETR